MLKPFGSVSLPGTVASFSADAGIGGGATGASFIAPWWSGRPSSGDPGGSGAAAAGAAGAGDCWATAGRAANTRVPKVPASSMARRAENPPVICNLPLRGKPFLRGRRKPSAADAPGCGPIAGEFPPFGPVAQSPRAGDRAPLNGLLT